MVPPPVELAGPPTASPGPSAPHRFESSIASVALSTADTSANASQTGASHHASPSSMQAMAGQQHTPVSSTPTSFSHHQSRSSVSTGEPQHFALSILNHASSGAHVLEDPDVSRELSQHLLECYKEVCSFLQALNLSLQRMLMGIETDVSRSTSVLRLG